MMIRADSQRLRNALAATMLVAAVLVAIIAVPGDAGATTTQDPPSALSGRWILNADLSDDPREVLAEAAETAGVELPPPPGRTGKPAGRGPGPLAGQGGPFANGELTVAVEADLVALSWADGRRHLFRLDESGVAGGGAVRRPPGARAGDGDGFRRGEPGRRGPGTAHHGPGAGRPARGPERRGPGAGRAGHGPEQRPRPRVAWEDGTLRLEIDTPRGQVRESYRLDDAGRLVQTIELPAPFADESVVVQRVYDPA